MTPEALAFGVKRAAKEDTFEALKQHLLSLQDSRGFWCGELECDVTTTADFILLSHFLSRDTHTRRQTASHPRVIKAANYILAKQNKNGAWPIYHNGPGDLSATVKAYFALKLAGFDRSDARLRQAAQFIINHGGIGATNTFMKFYLALFGQWPWQRLPAMPPELMLFPKSFPFHIYAMSSWSRGILVPMFLLYALKPQIGLPDAMGIAELTHAKVHRSTEGSIKVDNWSKLFYRIDYFLKGIEKNPIKPWRAKAIRRCLAWITKRLPLGQGLGSIWPAMINAAMALSCLDFPEKETVLAESLREIDGFLIEDELTLRVQPSMSPIWDTAVAMVALSAAGLPKDDTRLIRAGKWLLSREVRHRGDWKHSNPHGVPGGWCFQFKNDAYPDVDDTAMVLIALSKVDLGPEKTPAVDRAVAWILSMQNKDGGWGAFDRNNDKQFLTKVPFADHNAMIDPSTADVTARVVEALGTLGIRTSAMAKAFDFLRREQEQDGTWFGRWGVNYLYGTWSVTNAMCVWPSAGLDAGRALQWLRDRQNRDGGWGESCRSYDKPETKGRGRSTCSQTAWALNTFFNAGVFDDAAVIKGVTYLNRKIGSTGTVDEPEFTGTGFPSVFYLNYHLYRVSFPLLALSRYRAYQKSHETARVF